MGLSCLLALLPTLRRIEVPWVLLHAMPERSAATTVASTDLGDINVIGVFLKICPTYNYDHFRSLNTRVASG